jgi:hypothetical protein
MLIADEKLRNEAFDRRYERRLAFYQETSSLVGKILNCGISDEEQGNYRRKCLEARFLFDEPMHAFISAEILSSITWMTIAKQNSETQKLNATKRDDAKRSVAAHLQSFNDLSHSSQLHPSQLEKQFRPYLVQTPPKRPWLLRWP